jgi:hypothetical protein
MTLMPALLALFEKNRVQEKTNSSFVLPDSSPREARAGPQRVALAPLILTLSAVLTILCIVQVSKVDWDNLLETNLTRLRSEKSFQSGSGYWSTTLDEILGRGLSPVAVIADSPEKSRAIENALRKNHPELTKGIISLEPIFSAIQKDLPEKQTLLREIQRLFPPWKVARFSKNDRDRLAPLLDPGLTSPLSRTTLKSWLPKTVQTLFTEKNGASGKVFWLNPTFSTRSYSPDELDQWVEAIRSTARHEDPNSLIAGTLPLTRDLLMSVKKDAPKSALIAALGVLALIAVMSIKQWTRAIWLSLCVFLGVVWLGGWLVLSHQKMHFLNFLAIPITLGIGVDYGINFLEELARPRKAVNESEIQSTRLAVLLCSLTTLIGYGSLILADNRALRSFGWICVIGELTCLGATLITLPALWGILHPAAQTKNRLRYRTDRRSARQRLRRTYPPKHQKHNGD